MRRAALTIIALIVGTVVSGGAMAQTAGGGAAGGNAAGGGATGGGGTGAGGSVGAPLGPSTPGTAATGPLNPSTAVGTPSQRTLNGIEQNEQLRSPPTTTPPPAVDPSQAGSAATDTVAGPNDTTTGRSTIGGTATGRVAKDSNVTDGVDGPGELSPPTAFELYSGRVPKTP